MNTTELRKTNLVLRDGLITQVGWQTLGFDECPDEPIPITEKWLVDFGFEYHLTEKAANYTLNGFRFSYVFIGKFKGKVFCSFANIEFKDSFNCKYIHQLQNLYFALTGKELEYKP